MDRNTYWYILVASLSGGCIGILVMWNRRRSQIAGESNRRRAVVLAVGTAAFGGALWAFSRAFGPYSPAFAAVAMIAMTSWAAILQPAVAILFPRSVLSVRRGEAALLRAPWTGVRLFGTILRRTPLRHLGGRVYLSEVGRDPFVVLRATRDAQVVHIAAVLLCCPWLVIWGLQGHWQLITCGLAVHLPLNIYPILHLRHVTWRIERYVAKTRRSEGTWNDCRN